MSTIRADRLLSILLLLQSQRQLTAKELAEKLEVSKRTIYRDMEALSGIGIPVFSERGQNGGWSLVDGFQTRLTGMTETELRTLLVSPSIQLLDDLGLTRSSEEARHKLLASQPLANREKAMDVWNRLHIDTSGWRQQKETVTAFDVLKEAIWSDHKLSIIYEQADGKTAERVVSPLGLVAKGERWYLIAQKDNGAIRNYRASRIHSAALANESFKRPENFDLVNYWKASTAAFLATLPTFEVTVEVTAAIWPRLRYSGRFVRVIELGTEREQDWIPVKLAFDTKEEARGYILGFADQIKVIEPKELLSDILQQAEAAVAFYKRI